MSRSQEPGHDFQGPTTELKTLRDQIRLDLHLASMELREEWKKLEQRLPDPRVAGQQLRDATAESVATLVGELAKFRARLLDGREGRRLAPFMTMDVVTCGASDSVAQAIGIMWGRDVGYLPVVDDAHRVIGVITDRDVAVAAWSRGQRLEDITVASVMATIVHTCTSNDDARTALTLMRRRQVRRLPIVDDDGRLVGVVTLGDLARGLGRDLVALPPGPRQVLEALLRIVSATPEQNTSAN